MNNHRLGKSSEKQDVDHQIAFLEVDRVIVFFNEAKAVASIIEYDGDEPAKPRPKKLKGRREQNVKDLPVVLIFHEMSEEKLTNEFGEDGWYQQFTPAKVELEEHHAGVYIPRKTFTSKKRSIRDIY